jgi:hypothetical protein
LHQQLRGPAKACLAGEKGAEEGGGSVRHASGQVDAELCGGPRGRKADILGRLQQTVGVDAEKPALKREKTVQDLGHAGGVYADEGGVIAPVRKPLRDDSVNTPNIVRWYENVDPCHMPPILNDP